MKRKSNNKNTKKYGASESTGIKDRDRKRSNKSGKFSKFSKIDEEAVVSKDMGSRMNNDPNWYFTDATLADQVSMLSWNRFLGVDGPVLGTARVPNIMALRMNPSPGVTYSPESGYAHGGKTGFNMAIVKLFNKLSMKSGRNMAYAPQDVGIMILAMGEILSMVSYVRRLFGVAQVYNMRNRSFPRDIISAMGIDPEDFFNNYSDYRTRVNTLLASVNQLPIMTNNGYLRKCATMYDNMYQDVENPMCQVYMYIPHSTWLVDETTASTGTILKTTAVVLTDAATQQTVTRTFGDFMSKVLIPMVNNLLESSTLNLVYADLLNLADREDLSFFKFVPIEETYVVEPTYDRMVLKQIHNLCAIGEPTIGARTEYGDAVLTPFNDVYSNPNANGIEYNPGFNIEITFSGRDARSVILDTDNAMPDVSERIEMHRYTLIPSENVYTPEAGGVSYNFNVAIPDHYCVWFELYTGSTEVGSTRKVTKTWANVNLTTGPWAYNAESMLQLETFDWHPTIYVTEAANGNVRAIQSDLGYFTVIDHDYLVRINQLIYMGLFEMR